MVTKNKFDPLVLFCCVFMLTQACTSETYEVTPMRSACIASERDALHAVKAGLVDPRNRLSSWKGPDCCKWRGVACSKATTHVVRLDLRNTYNRYDNYYGSIIDMSYALGGEIRSPILLLRHLHYLDLSYNNFSGGKIPEFIGSLTELTYLNLSTAGFGGKIPPQIGNLLNLKYLDLSSSVPYLGDLKFFGLDGKIPPQIGNLTNLQYLDLSGWSNNLYTDEVTWLTHSSSLKHLNLGDVNLSSVTNWERLGTLPYLKKLYLSDCGLDDTIFTLSRVNFTKLVELDLGSNGFSNPLSLNWISNLTDLNYVDFSWNELDVRVINIIENINSVETLYLSENNLMDMKASDLKNLTNLKGLGLEGAQITGDISELMENLPLQGLQSLDLGGNNFSGNLSSWIGHMTSLSYISLFKNNLSGLIPLSIRRLIHLVYLDLSNNIFHGTITENHLSKMLSLDNLWLSGNPLKIKIDTNWIPPFRLSEADFSSCNLGPKFPQWLKSQTRTDFLDISNTSITDEVPAWFWHVFSNASYLDLSKNNLWGWMPESLKFMSVTTLFLNDNKLKGLIPKLPQSLQLLDLSRNLLSGTLPSNMKDVPLRYLELNENLLNGSIPHSLCQLQQLEYLDLSKNNLVGNFPNCWENNLDAININYSKREAGNQSLIKQRALQFLTLSNNNLSGEFPEYVKHCSNLVLLNLEYNNFYGSIPSWIGEELPSLSFLLLGFNKFSGPLPNKLFKLKHLQVLDFSHNNLNGTIPHSLKTLKAMIATNDSDSKPIEIFGSGSSFFLLKGIPFVTEIDTKGQVLLFGENINNVRSFDLSCNNLVGHIPEEIGTLIGLISLNLSGNEFSGNIPKSIGYIESLESLDLSTNILSGLIPSSLSDLTFLSHLNLSYNNLSGRIPSGHQLETLDDSSIYEGNSGLCGFPLPIECYENRTTSHPLVLEKEDGYEIHVGAIVGFAIGVWIVYGALLLVESWKVAYFLFVDKVYDWIYVLPILNWARIAQNREENWLKGSTKVQNREGNC